MTDRAPTPPRLARAILSIVSPAEDRELLLGDLAERYRAIASSDGPARASRWYWGQALRGVPAGVLATVDSLWRGSGGGLGADIGRSVRSLRRRPLYAAGVTGTMAMGIASLATVLSIAWNVWLSPLPIPEPDRVVRVFEVAPPDEAGERARQRVSPPLMEDMRAREWSTLTAVAGVSRNLFDWNREGRVTRVRALLTSPEAYAMLGITPRLGRAVSPDPDAREVVLTEPFWERAFGAATEVVGGTTLMLNGEAHAVVGVTALPHGYPDDADILTLLRWSDDQLSEGMRGARYLDVIARLAPGRSVTDAAAEIDTWISGLGAVHANHDGWGGSANGLMDELLAPYRGVLMLLLAAGGLFLMLAMANVVGLVAARSVDGRRDRQVRLALGASQAQLMRASAIDGAVLGAIAATGALATTALLMGPVRALVPADIPRVELIGLDAGLAASLAAVAVLSGLAVGALGHALTRGIERRRTGSDGASGARARAAVVAGQVALTVLLTTGGAVVLSRMSELRNTDLGFDAAGVSATPLNLAGARYPNPEARLAFWDEVMSLAEGRGLDLTFGTSAPMAGVNMPWGYRSDPTGEQRFAQYHIVEADYFDVLGIDLLEGRLFRSSDRGDTERVAIVNRRFAEVNFPDGRVIGREIEVVSSMRRIVGVVESVRHFGPAEEAPEEIYAPYGQDPWPHAQILLAGDPGALNSAVADLVLGIDPQLELPPLFHYTDHVADWFAAIRLQAIVVGILAIVGTLLATLGLYSLVAYRVSSNRREIGIRMALGATDRTVFGGVVLRGALLATGGIVVGSLAWMAVSERVALLLESPEAGVQLPIAVAIAVGLVSVAACAVPAARSVTVDPARTLRAEER